MAAIFVVGLILMLIIVIQKQNEKKDWISYVVFKAIKWTSG